MEMEVNVTKRVIKTVRGRGGKLVKKPFEVKKIVKKIRILLLSKILRFFSNMLLKCEIYPLPMLSLGSARMEVGVRSSLWSLLWTNL